MSERLYSFVGGAVGAWRVAGTRAVVGEELPEVAAVSVVSGEADGRTAWVLRGVTSNLRYTTRGEADELAARQEGLGRPGATRAVLIPIKKSDAWWALTQDERRAVFADEAVHTVRANETLPAVARRLHHCRDLGDDEPFDFLTWFEFAPDAEPAFDALLDDLRASAEWRFVEREFEVRLER